MEESCQLMLWGAFAIWGKEEIPPIRLGEVTTQPLLLVVEKFKPVGVRPMSASTER